MALNTYLGGTLNFLAGGLPYQVAGEFSEDIGGLVYEGRAGLSGIAGATSKYEAHMVDVEIFDDGTVSTDLLFALIGKPCTIAYKNGKTVALTGCWIEGKISAKPANGTLSFKIGATTRTEIPA